MDRFNVAVDVVQNAGDLLRQCRLEESEICQKTGHQDLVTHWDRKIEQLLRNEILTAFPQDSIVGEEYPPEAHRTGSMTWYIDPIDGTTNFINQHQNYAISVGCWEGSTPLFGLVLDVERETLYWAKRGGGAWQDQTQIHTSGRRELAGSDADPYLRPAGAGGVAADDAGTAIYLSGVPSISETDDPTFTESAGGPMPWFRGLGIV